MSDDIEPASEAPSEPQESKPTIFDHESGKDLSSELGRVYDKAEAVAEKATERRDVPSTPADSFDEAFEKTYDWMHASPAEKQVARDAANLVEQVRENAKKFGVELSDADAMKAAMELEREQARGAPAVPSELAPAVESIKQSYPEHEPQHVIKEWSRIDSDFRKDPVQTAFRIVQQQTGMSPLDVATQIARQALPQHVQAHFVERDVKTFYQLVPDAARYESQMLAAIESEAVQRSGDIISDLQKVYNHVRGNKQRGSRKGGSKIDASIEAAYDRAASR
jgi:hypothetical protein